MALRFRVRNGTVKEKFHCTRCARRLITVLLRPTRFTARSESNIGCVEKKNGPPSLPLLLPRRHRRHPSQLKSRRKLYAIDAKTREVSESPTWEPQGVCFTQSQDRFWRVWSADTRARVDHQHATGSRPRRAHSQHEAQRKIVDPCFPR